MADGTTSPPIWRAAWRMVVPCSNSVVMWSLETFIFFFSYVLQIYCAYSEVILFSIFILPIFSTYGAFTVFEHLRRYFVGIVASRLNLIYSLSLATHNFSIPALPRALASLRLSFHPTPTATGSA